MSRFVRRMLTPACVLGTVILAVPHAISAVEPAGAFVEGMRQRGYYELATEYLESLKTSKLVSPEFKQTITYEQGVTLIGASKMQRDAAVQSRQLDEAQAKLKEFIQTHGNHPQATAATNQLGNVSYERARLNSARAEMPSMQTRKAELLDSARKHYDEAQAVFEDLIQDLRGKLGELPKHIDEKNEPELHARQYRYRAEYVQAQLVAATILYEMARTYEKDSEDFKKHVKSAAEKYAEIGIKYRTRGAGLYALLYEAQCRQDLGELEDALTLFEDLFDLSEEQQIFRNLKTKAVTAALGIWIDPSQKKYVGALAAGSEWLNKARKQESRSADWLKLRLALAKVYQAAADELRKTKPADPWIDKHIREAKTHAKEVMRYSPELKKEAQQLLAALGSVVPDAAKPEPKTFAEAKTAGKESLDLRQSSTFLVKVLEGKRAKEPDKKKQEEFEAQIAEANKAIQTNHDEAVRLFRRALELADAKTELEDINVVRYFLSFLYYSQDDFYDAAVMSEFLARRHPQSAGARQCAEIAMKSYMRIYQSVKDQPDVDTSFEIAHIASIADYISKRWPDQTAADDALITLINITIRQGKLDEAQNYLDRVAVKSPRRGEAELKTGQALWSKYLGEMAAIDKRKEQEDPPSEEELQATRERLGDLKVRAKKTLADGIERMKAGELNPTLASAVLSLAQIYLDTDEPVKCTALLEESKIGSIVMVKSNHPAVDRPGYADETYKTALRAYISTLPKAKSVAEGNAVMEKAEGIMDALEQSFGSTAEGKNKLIAIYISLARDLERQLDLATDKSRKALSDGFEKFLERVADRSQDFKTLNWTAEMFFSLGKSNDTDEGKLTAESRGFYDKAITVYEKILEKREAFHLEDKMVVQVRMRMATTKRRMGKFQEAIEMFYAILKEKGNNNMINVQLEAVVTYQEWADSGSGEDGYERAIKGGKVDKAGRKYVIWGWGKMAKKAAHVMRERPRFHDTFYRARYNLARCRYQQAIRKQGNDRTTRLKLAKRDVSLTARLYPGLGGDKWKPQFDALMKRIQQGLGEDPVGLQIATTND